MPETLPQLVTSNQPCGLLGRLPLEIRDNIYSILLLHSCFFHDLVILDDLM